MVNIITFPNNIERLHLRSKTKEAQHIVAHFIWWTIECGNFVNIKIWDKIYKWKITSINRQDKNGNILKIEYVIPFLNSDDPLKYWKAPFSYKSIWNE